MIPPPPLTKTEQIVLELPRYRQELNQALREGFKVISHVAQHVSTGSSVSMQGIIYFVLERTVKA